MQLQVIHQHLGLELAVPLEDHLADRVAGPLADDEGQVDLAGVGTRTGHHHHLGLEVPLALVVVDELLPVLLEHVAMILAEEAEDRLAGGDVGLQHGVRDELVALEIDAANLDLGPLEDLHHDLGIAGIAALDQLDLGQVVALLLVEAVDRVHRVASAHVIGAVPLLQAGVILDVLEADRLPPPELDVGQLGHLVDGEDQGELAALGRRFVVVGLDRREPVVLHEGLDVGVDLLNVEGLAHLAEELALDLLGRDGGVPLEPDLGDLALGEPGGLAECPGREQEQAAGEHDRGENQRAARRGTAGRAGPGPGRRGRCRPDRVHCRDAGSGRGSGRPARRPSDSAHGGLPWRRRDLAFVRSHERSFPDRQRSGAARTSTSAARRHPRRRDGNPSAGAGPVSSRPVRRVPPCDRPKHRARQGRGDLPGRIGARCPRPSRIVSSVSSGTAIRRPGCTRPS